MAIQSNFPAIKPSLNLDFANTKKLDSRITFTRASTATYYDGVTTAKAEENLFRQSQDFTDVTYWITNAASVSYTANTTVAPDGTTTADTMTASVGTGTRFGSGSATNGITTGLVYTASLFVKAGTDTVIQLLFPTGQFGADAYANFDLSAGTVGSVGASATATISSAGGTWYRCVITATATASSTTSIGIGFAFTGNNSSAARLPSITAAGTETLILWGAQLEQRSSVTSYTATTTQAITNYIPVLQTAAANVARFDHTPTTGEALGLLVEEQRTNLLTYSADFANAAWIKTRSSITSNTIVAPDGTLTGDKFVENTDNNSHFFNTVSAAISNATTYAFSVYAKAGERSVLQLSVGGFIFNTVFANFDLSNGTVSSISPSGITASITPIGNGWYRCVAVSTSIASSAGYGPFWALQNSPTAARLATYQGDGYSGIYIWGAQLEAGAFPTSYIATGAATATRSADAASMTGTNFSSWYNQGEGTLYSESIVGQIGVASITLSVSDGTANNRLQIQRTLGNNYQNLVVVNGVTQSSVSISGVAANVVAKQADAFQLNNFQTAVNGTLGTADTTGTVPTVLQMEMGSRAGALFINGTIKRISYYPLRLTDAQLQALTG